MSFEITLCWIATKETEISYKEIKNVNISVPKKPVE